MSAGRPYSLYPGSQAAVPSADRKPASVSHPGVPQPSQDPLTPAEEAAAWVRAGQAAETAMWLTNQLGRPFPVERVYPGHIANYLAWKAVYGRG